MVKTLGIITSDYENITVEEILEYFKSKNLVQLDTETTGFDKFNNDLVCVQLGDFDNQFVITPNYLHYFKDFLETKTLLGHNIKFDLGFLYRYGIFPNFVYDTFLAERVLFNGDILHRAGLGKVAKARLDIDLDKSIRDNIWKEGLTKRVIQYSADDVKYLELIKNSQEIELKSKNLEKCLKIENNYVLALAYIEYCGFKLDKDKWHIKMSKDLNNLKTAKETIDKLIFDKDLKKYIDYQGDLFSEGLGLKINWDSPKQVIELFQSLGVPTHIVEKGVEKESVGAKAIAKFEKQYPFISDYLRYKEYQKLVGTYGENFINQINKITGRLHTNYSQIMNTGRISSGGKNRELGTEYINMQNIPADSETRSCFVSEKGNVMVICDYSGQEQIVLANKSLDPNLLKFYDDGLSDMHSFTASNMYPELHNIPLDDIKESYKDKRQAAKSAGFAINYGGNETTIATNENIPIEDAKNIYDKYFEAFPGLKDYFEEVKQQGLRDGFILISSVSGRKWFIHDFDRYLDLKKELNRTFWDRWKYLKQHQTDPCYIFYKEKIKEFFQIKGKIERLSLNAPIQGSSAEITKISAILFFKWIKENNYLNIVKFCNQVHDENITECPISLSEEVKINLERCMKQAGEIYCKRIPLRAEAIVADHWVH